MLRDDLKLWQSQHWAWHLFANQCYLGRVQFTLVRECQGSLADLDTQEWADLLAGLKRFEALARSAFGAEKFNYKQLGNQWPQVHVHAIPRYCEPPTWSGIAFPDRRWGDDPYPEFDSPIDAEATVRLAHALRQMVSGAQAGPQA